MGFVEGHLGTVVAAYAATGLGIGALIAWVVIGHARARRDLARLDLTRPERARLERARLERGDGA